MKEIYIRKMRYEEARYKLERELQDAFMEGETLVQVVHGIGEGKLKQLTLTKLEIMGLDKQDLKRYKK